MFQVTIYGCRKTWTIIIMTLFWSRQTLEWPLPTLPSSICATPCKYVSLDICGQRRPRSSAQSDHGRCCTQLSLGATHMIAALWEKSVYSWLSLSRTRLSRITAYLEVKIWSPPKHENLTTCKKYCGKEKKLLLRSNFSSFPQYFQYISNFKSPITHIFVKCG